MAKKNFKPSARNNNPNSNSMDISDTIVGAMTLYFTESGLVLIDNGNIMDIGLRVQILEAALHATKVVYENFNHRDENGILSS